MAYGYIELEVKENNTAVMNTAIIKCVLGDYLKIFQLVNETLMGENLPRRSSEGTSSEAVEVPIINC